MLTLSKQVKDGDKKKREEAARAAVNAYLTTEEEKVKDEAQEE